ncbi:MAG TPA: DUF1304 domain-containing protein [Pseudomonadota bacterium]|jgi:putative membrane protein|nr:DUF1304 domain-containing protein [Deltaproteobacteria bacterium]HPH28171.1 DUF1304 domain-containing protein [Pseudomonadota bacterium]
MSIGKLLPSALIVLVALEHIYFMILEMFLWQRPLGLKTFNHTAEHAKDSAVLAANQGLYNGILAAGLLFSLIYPLKDMSLPVRTFFLASVVVAGLYGGATVSSRIVFIQAMPALLALVALWATR